MWWIYNVKTHTPKDIHFLITVLTVCWCKFTLFIVFPDPCWVLPVDRLKKCNETLNLRLTELSRLSTAQYTCFYCNPSDWWKKTLCPTKD